MWPEVMTMKSLFGLKATMNASFIEENTASDSAAPDLCRDESERS